MKLPVLMLTALAAAGCTSPMVRSVKPEDRSNTTGITYYLPMRLVTVRFERKLNDSKVVKDLADAKTALEKAEAAEKTVKLALDHASGILAKLPPGDSPARTGAAARQATLSAEHQLLRDQTGKAKAKVASAQSALDQYRSSSDAKYIDTMKISLSPALPDPGQRFSANIVQPAQRDVQMVVKTTPTGLLTSAEGSTTDQTQAILVSAVNLLAQAQLAKSGSTVYAFDGGADRGLDRAPKLEPFVMEWTFDPRQVAHCRDATCDHWLAISQHLNARGANYRFVWQPLQSYLPDTLSVSDASTCAGVTSDHGLFYRRQLPYVLAVIDGSGTPIQSLYLELPNEAPIELLPLCSRTAVTTVHKVKFVDGMLTEYETDRPSPALAIINIPVEVLKAVVSIPAQIVQFRYDNTKAQTDLINQQKALADAITALAAAQAAANAGTGPSAQPDPDSGGE